MVVRNWLRALRSDERGNIGIIFGAMIVPVIMLMGSSIDFGKAMQAKSELQGAADAAALAAAILVDAQTEVRVAEANTVFAAKLAGSNLRGTSPTVTISDNKITVEASARVDTAFLGIINMKQLELDAFARAQSGYAAADPDDDDDLGKVCLLALDPDSTDGIHIQGNNAVSHPSCWGYTNSNTATAINAVGSQATAVGEGYCAVGDYDAEHDNFSPDPSTGCSTAADPFATVGAYEAGAYTPTFTAPVIPAICKANNLNLKKGTYTLEPGRYCGGISLQAQAKVTLLPGIYIIDNGLLNVQSGSWLQGSNVMLYFSGANARMTIIGGGTIDLKGRNAGSTYGGYLAIAHPDAWRDGESNIQGGGTFNMEGVLYMPTQRIEVSGNGNVNGSTKYFGMIAKDFYFRGNGTFTLKGHDGTSALTDLLPDMPRQQRQNARLVK